MNVIPQSVTVLIMRTDKLILGVSRKDNKDDFGLPGGKIDAGEDHESAAIREFKEETGAEIDNLAKIYTGFCPGGKDGIAYFNHTFMPLSINLEDLKQQKDEGRLAWVSRHVLLYSSFRIFNNRLFEYLGLFQGGPCRAIIEDIK